MDNEKLRMQNFKFGETDERQIYYLSVYETNNWIDLLPTKNWVVLIIGDIQNKVLIEDVTNACLDNNVTWVCCAGKECEWMHDWFDESIVEREINDNIQNNNTDCEIFDPMTTWGEDIDEEFWFALFTAYDLNIEINKVVCLDLTEIKYKGHLIKLLDKINQGWIPEYNLE